MRAVQFSEYGEPDVLHVAEAPEPHAGEGQIRIAVKAAGVNPIDWKIRSGAMEQVMPAVLPRITGSEAAGVVDEVGPGVTGVTAGDEVFGSSIGGGAAQYTLLSHFAVKPASLSWEEAAGLPVAAETSVRSLDLLGVQAGQVLLVNGAAGGVGSVAVQFARARGARVIGTAGKGNHEFLRSIGVEPTTYGDGLIDRVRRLAPEGVDRAFDTAGRGALPDLVALTGDPDHVITIADFSAAEHGVRVTSGDGLRAWHALAEAAELYEAGRLVLPVAQAFSFEEAPEAHRVSQAGHVRGKLVLIASAERP